MINTNQQIRSYEDNTPVYNQYRLQRQKQTYEFAKSLKERHNENMKTSTNYIDVMKYIDMLDDFIDNSDPDLSLSNINHLYQTAEAIRKDKFPEWLQLVGFIHDLGKVIGIIFNNDNDGTSAKTQWSIVGDTYILGCKLRNDTVFPELDSLSPDMSNDLYNTDMGIYKSSCGLSNCVLTWGHDEFMYDVLQFNRKMGRINNLPEEADYVIRFHSLYPWHAFDNYNEFEDELDKKNKYWVQLFNKYDLYTKENKRVDIETLKPYYRELINKFFPNGLIFN
jgi:inositol oxygenase